MDEARIFSAVHSDRMRSDGLRLKHEFSTNMQNNFCTVGLPREVVEPPMRHSRPVWMPTCTRKVL